MIKITDRFYINANSNCYTLQEKMIVQDVESKNYGKEVFKELGYYTTIESCLKGFVTALAREFVNKQTENSIADLIEEEKRLQEVIKSLNIKI